MRTDYEPGLVEILGGLALMVLVGSLLAAVHPLALPLGIVAITLLLIARCEAGNG